MGAAGRPDRTVVVQRVIDAPAETIFDVLATPTRHQEFDGSGTLDGSARGPERLAANTSFSMAMHQGPAKYRSLNRIVEFEQDRVIAWATVGEYKGRRFIGGQTWRFQLVPQQPTEGDDLVSTLVLHSYDWGAAKAAPLIGLLGYPRRAAPSMRGTLQRLADAVSTS